MSKLHFKGGPWTKPEDAVLQAALAQYGLRDWERVASMLTKKTATQCRERWENYIDPRLNIREAWSLEEEEKLVELQSLFPNKFRLISEQLTRRTPTHYIRPAWLCEQRYLELKDEQEHYIKQQQQQQQGDTEDSAKQSLEAFMSERRRRRNARKTHEERAPRADTVSGDLYEREMVSMATSRLANQDQKKGLRKERQRQLEEAAFLAKLESNREGIESGTLSLRQSKKMRKALDEDRQTTGLVDLVAEDGEDDDGEDDDAVGRAASDNSDADDENNNGDFKAIDMYEDQQQAGLVKKQRVLMKDLTGQQRVIQERQLAGGDAEEEDDDDGEGGHNRSSSSQSRARSAITGVNQDLLKQLTAGPSGKAFTSAAAAPRLRDRLSLTDDAAIEAQSELKNSLAELFAALPQAATPVTSGATDTLPPPLPPPPLKRPRDTLPTVSAQDVADRAAPPVSSMAATTESVPGDLFSSLNLPAPRKQAKTEAEQLAAAQVMEELYGDAHDEADDSDARVNSASQSAMAAQANHVGAHAVEAAIDHARVAFSSVAEEDAYVQAARQWVAVECEKEVTAATSHANGTHTSRAGSSLSPSPLTTAEREAVEKLILSEMEISRRGKGEEVTDALASVRAYVDDKPHYTDSVNVQSALHQLSAQVAAQVQEANALLEPLRQEWEQVLSIAMLHPRELHVLQGYVRDDGHLKRPAASAEGGEVGEASPSSFSSSSSVAAYAYERLINELTRARQATRFIASLRDREQMKMRRNLDAAEFELMQLQAREKTLQDMYRQKRVQQS